MALTDVAARQAKPGTKTQRKSDGGGLFLEIRPNGSKYWRLAYRFGGKQKLLALGVYPNVSLLKAREGRETAKKQIANGIDPGNAKKTLKLVQAGEGSFENVAREWFAQKSPVWAESHSSKIIARLELDIFPWIGAKQINTVTAPELLAVLRRIESRGAVDTANRAKQNCSQIFRYAIATGRTDRDPAADLRGALKSTRKRHYPTIIDPGKIGELMRAIDGYSGSLLVRCAIKLAPLVFVRPGELRHAEWSEIDFTAAEWRIPAHKMKMKTMHLVPLSKQATDILKDIQPLTGEGKYIFPGERTLADPISNNTINAALRRLGYTKDEMTGHGFRAMASTRLYEMGWPSDVIERQLAHGERNTVKAAYCHAEYLDDRKKMMQVWADYLDRLKTGEENEVVPIRSAG
ncbi:MAG: tyrosine-type recombinase/integrase [Proteobacteria bacterium]|nr:tyrosine-type recombinase/integrase [Pseudomonadota bacterium]MBU1686138.1 tyrosine-type recombinase/integrase [Pseudomonadota bacterium]